MKRTRINLCDEVYKEMAKDAKRHGRTINQHIAFLVSRYIEKGNIIGMKSDGLAILERAED
jgi:hypothetical protein